MATRLFSLICILLAGVGCTTLQKPSAIITGSSLQGVTPEGFTVGLNLDVSNPNEVVIPLSGATYSVNVVGTKLFDGVASPSASIPAKGTLPVTLPITFAFKDLLGVKESLISSGGALNYDLKGALEFDDGSPFPMLTAKVPLEYAGKVDLKQVLNDPQILLQSPIARELAKKILGNAFGF